MNWLDVAKKAAAIGLPVLGTALGGGAGASVGSMIASALGCDPTPTAVAATMTPENVVALQKIQSDERVAIAAAASSEHIAQINADAKQVEAVSQTIQADQTGKSWLQRNVQALCKLWAMAAVSGIYIVLPMMKIPVPEVDQTVWLMIGAILGVTAWHNGQTDTAKVKAAAQVSTL